jgi:putative ABC transport system permease protein
MLNDLRFAVRQLIKSPGFTAVAVLTLALGIGANTAIFSIVNSVLLRPLPYAAPQQLFWVWEKDRQSGTRNLLSPITFNAIRTKSDVLSEIAAAQVRSFNVAGGGPPERLGGSACSSNLFSLLGTKPIIGRTFLADEEQPGKDKVVILTQRLWERRFGADPNILGKTIKLDGEDFDIVGVVPYDFFFRGHGVWVPLSFSAEEFQKANRNLNAYVRLRPDSTQAQAEAALTVTAERLEREYPDTNKGFGLMLEPMKEPFVGHVRRSLYALLGAVGFVLLVACANVANLSLSKAAARRPEMAIRAALGASRARLLRQLCVESTLLATLGGVLGLLLAVWGLEIVRYVLPPDTVPGLESVGIDGAAIAFTVVILSVTAVLVGLLPAWQLREAGLNLDMQAGKRGLSTVAGGRRTGSVLAVAQIALALVLLAGAGLMIRSFLRLQSVELGFKVDNALDVFVALPEIKYESADQRRVFFRQVIERIRSLPGIEAVGAINPFATLGWSSSGRFGIDGRPQTNGLHTAEYCIVDPDYFHAMKIPLIRGRGLTETGRDEILINEAMARRHWPDEDPVGKRVRPEGSDRPWLTIVGIAGSIRFWGSTRTPPDQVYQTYLQHPEHSMSLIVRTAGVPFGAATMIRKEVWGVDKDLPVSIQTLQQEFGRMFWQTHFSVWLFSFFAAIALVLASVGIYGVISHGVTRRTREIGTRVALGAARSDVVKLILREGMLLGLAGIGAGLIASAWLSRFIASQLYGVAPLDALVLSGVSLLLLCVAFLACYLPARRAARVDPIIALRCE